MNKKPYKDYKWIYFKCKNCNNIIPIFKFDIHSPHLCNECNIINRFDVDDKIWIPSRRELFNDSSNSSSR